MTGRNTNSVSKRRSPKPERFTVTKQSGVTVKEMDFMEAVSSKPGKDENQTKGTKADEGKTRVNSKLVIQYWQSVASAAALGIKSLGDIQTSILFGKSVIEQKDIDELNAKIREKIDQ